jgi:flagellar hook protein FlgE
MSLYGMMRTGSSGMNAQASRLSTVADNIANASTTGYKAASTEFSSLLLPSISGNYNSGAVETDVRYGISNQGALTYTSSSTDLAINGSGFFVVEDPNGVPYMTRAGAFVPNADGELVNAAGYKLLGYPYTTEDPTPVVNGFDGLSPVTVSSSSLVASMSTEASLTPNLPSNSDVIDNTGNLTPGTVDNTADTLTSDNYTSKTSLKAYDSLGNEVLLDIYFTKTSEYDPAAGTDDEWEVAIYNQADADAATGSFPYASDALVTDTFIFDTSTGGLIDDGVTTSPTSITIDADTITNMSEDFVLDLSQMTQLNYDFTPGTASVDGNAPSQVKEIQISEDGIVYAQYENGDLNPLYRVAMANVESPDNLQVVSGNVYAQSVDSGVVVLGFPGNAGLGSLVSGALESSTVDLAEELTTMIESQRTYTANSKVFQTGSDLMDILVNLKR